MSITPEKLAELKALLAKAPSPPWHVDEGEIEDEGITNLWRDDHDKRGRVMSATATAHDVAPDTARFIVAAVNALPDLLATIDNQQQEIEEFRAAWPTLRTIQGELVDAGNVDNDDLVAGIRQLREQRDALQQRVDVIGEFFQLLRPSAI